jgi:hypothetical protein
MCETIVQLEYEHGCRQSAERDGWIAALKTPKGIATDKQPGGHVARRDAALASSKREVSTQLAKRMFGWQWN